MVFREDEEDEGEEEMSKCWESGCLRADGRERANGWGAHERPNCIMGSSSGRSCVGDASLLPPSLVPA